MQCIYICVCVCDVCACVLRGLCGYVQVLCSHSRITSESSVVVCSNRGAEVNASRVVRERLVKISSTECLQ